MRAVLVNIRNYGLWLLAGASFLLSKDHATIALTPPPVIVGKRLYLFKTQRVLHRDHGRIIALAIESVIEFYVLRNIFSLGSYDLTRLAGWPDIKDAYEQIVASGKIPLIVDCGANIGFSAIYFALQFPAARIAAIEPQPQNFERACAATKGFERIRVTLAGVACDPGSARVVDPGKGPDAYRTEMSDGGDVRMVNIDSVLREEGPFTVPFAVKIDIEGFESNLFKRNTEWIDRFFVLMIELHDWLLPHQANSRNFLKAISQYDRDFVYFDENIFSIKNPDRTPLFSSENGRSAEI